jgi:hypothetical protein
MDEQMYEVEAPKSHMKRAPSRARAQVAAVLFSHH